MRYSAETLVPERYARQLRLLLRPEEQLLPLLHDRATSRLSRLCGWACAAMAVVHIAASLARYADGERRLVLEGSTVGEVLRGLGERYPRFRDGAFDGGGALRPHIAVFLNSTQITGNSDLGTGVGDGDEIAVISAIAGG